MDFHLALQPGNDLLPCLTTALDTTIDQVCDKYATSVLNETLH